MIKLWLKGKLTNRGGRLTGSIVGVALAVAILASLGTFLATTSLSMTKRAIGMLPVDWQVQLTAATTSTTTIDEISRAIGYEAVRSVTYADVAGLETMTGGTTQTTGSGQVLGLEPGYTHAFPGQIRLLAGAGDGVALMQQTAANLHATVGDTVSIQRVGLPPVSVVVGGIVDLPNADSMFQAIGVSQVLAPRAPPDNVILVPAAQWRQLLGAQASARPDTTRQQLHVRLARDHLPPEPSAAYVKVQAAARNLEARLAGSGVIADNLAARLDGVRSDALYARMVFLFLGLPGALLALLMTVAVATADAEQQQRDRALLRMRGASARQILILSVAEALALGAVGGMLGVVVAEAVTALFLGSHVVTTQVIPSAAGAALFGLVAMLVAIAWPAWHELRGLTTIRAGRLFPGGRVRLWERLPLDLICLAISAASWALSASNGYQLVLAPEGVAEATVDYQAFIAPLFLWLGMGLFTLRLMRVGLHYAQPALSLALKPIAGRLSTLMAVSLGRQWRRMAYGAGTIGLALAFGISTAIFNTTYESQLRVDAELSNGADVSVTGTTTAPAGPWLSDLAAFPGVAAAATMRHRFAYVGTDLQDLYGIDPEHFAAATDLRDAYFVGADAGAVLAALRQTPDGVLVSEETMSDFQLQPGDLINLRLQKSTDHQYHVVPFHVVGVVREFPTAPRDSFLVANAGYVGAQTAMPAAEIVLLRTVGDPAAVADDIRHGLELPPAVKVTDATDVQRLIASSLTAVDVRGLTRLQLIFAVLLVIAATGLVLGLRWAERRRSFAILTALGAKPHQLAGFVHGEALLILGAGIIIGLPVGLGLAWMLVKLLAGAFDPAPDSLDVPWAYLLALVFVAMLSTALTSHAVLKATSRHEIRSLREI